MRQWLYASAIWLVTTVLAAPFALAQDEAPYARLAIMGGQLRYRLPEARNDALVALRLPAALAPLGGSHWLLEPGMSYGWYRGNIGDRRHTAIGELQLQFQTGTSRLQPYVGVGGGVGVTRIDSTTLVRPTLSASAGLRVDLLRGLGIIGELRLRRLGLFRDWTRELTAGLYAAFR